MRIRDRKFLDEKKKLKNTNTKDSRVELERKSRDIKRSKDVSRKEG